MVSFITAVEMNVNNLHICVQRTNEQNNIQTNKQTQWHLHTTTDLRRHFYVNFVPTVEKEVSYMYKVYINLPQVV